MNYEHDNFDFSEAVPVFASLNNKTLKLSHPRPDVMEKELTQGLLTKMPALPIVLFKY